MICNLGDPMSPRHPVSIYQDTHIVAWTRTAWASHTHAHTHTRMYIHIYMQYLNIYLLQIRSFSCTCTARAVPNARETDKSATPVSLSARWFRQVCIRIRKRVSRICELHIDVAYMCIIYIYICNQYTSKCAVILPCLIYIQIHNYIIVTHTSIYGSIYIMSYDTHVCICPPAPMNQVKYLRAGPAEMPFWKLVHRQYKSFPPDRFCQVEIQKTTGLSNKPSTA